MNSDFRRKLLLFFTWALSAAVLSSSFSSAQTPNPMSGIFNTINASFLGVDPIDPTLTPLDPKLLPQSPTPDGKAPQPLVIEELRIQVLEGKEWLQVKIIGMQEWLKVAPLVTLPAGTRIYTWAPNEDAARWEKQGGVDEEEVKWLVTKGSGAAGGGFYASLNPVDSITYGDRLLEQRISAPVKLLSTQTNSFTITGGALQTPAALQKMRDIGLVGFRYSDTWMNWIANPGKVLGGARIIENFAAIAPTLLEIQKTRPDLVFNRYSYLVSAIVRFNETVPAGFSFIKELSKFGLDSEIFKNGLPLPEISFPEGKTPGDYKNALHRLLDEMSPYINQRAVELKRDLSQALSAPFTEEKLSKVCSLGWGNSEEKNFRGFGIGSYGPPVIDEISLMAKVEYPIPKSIQGDFGRAPQWPVVTLPAAALQSSFPKQLASALRFIDLPDLILAMADGNPKPWTLYDSSGDTPSLGERWSKLDGELHMESFGPSLSPMAVRLTKAGSIFSEGKITGFRDRDIWAGGDLYPDMYGGYYRITESELKTLQENTLLTVRFKPDPDSRPGKPTVLARHRYLSVQDYKKVQTWLTPEFTAELAAAEANGVFRKPDLDSYKKLTTRFLETMVNSIFKTELSQIFSFFMMTKKLELATTLRILMSIHPLDDFNGRSIRIVLGSFLGAPLFLSDWNDDLTAPLLVLSDRIEAGKSAVSFIEQGLLKAETQNPIFPKYYDIPEWYQLLAGVPKISGDPAVFVAKMKEYLRKPETRELIRQKRFSELKFPGTCEQNLKGPKD